LDKAKGMSRARRRNTGTAVVLFAVAGGMVGLAFASVPLYRLFCQVTGYGGTPRIAERTEARPASDRTVTVTFDANVNPALPWRFKPTQRERTVRLGQEVLAFFEAKNLSDTPLVGTATFNVTPFKAAPYFNKVQCFCFTEQVLAPGEVASMPVSFFVDPEISSDPNTKDITAITLSYTFYPARDQGKAQATVNGTEAPGGRRGGGRG